MVIKQNFASDKNFLKKHLTIVELTSGDLKLLISPKLQGRVFTSSANGDEGFSFGWINYNLISSGKILKNCNNFGGEDRFWLGPEGGQYSIFFEPGTEFDLDNWQTPAPIDTESWELIAHSSKKAIFEKELFLPNYAGTKFHILADREVAIFDNARINKELNIKIPDGIDAVGFESTNCLTNKNDFTWTTQTGMPSIWILGQLISTEKSTIILPFDQNGNGKIINDAYFGKIDDDRINILDKTILFRADGNKRGKIGIGPNRAKSIIGSYDATNETLTIVKYSLDKSSQEYVNSMWEYQEHPFTGDIVNAYNDGPLPDGSQMGPFYELETSSPAASLASEETLQHKHATFHFIGNKEILEKISMELLGVSFDKCF